MMVSYHQSRGRVSCTTSASNSCGAIRGVLCVLATFTMWGWYVFWLYNALQNFTIVPWP